MTLLNGLTLKSSGSGGSAALDAASYRELNEGNFGLAALAARGIAAANSNGTDTSGTGQMRYEQRIAGRSLRLEYVNHSNSGASSVELSGPNPITVKASILLSRTLGIPSIPVTFGGASSITIQPDAAVLSDPVELDIPQGTLYWVVTYVSVTTAGMKWPMTSAVNAGRGEGFAVGVDHTATANGIPSPNNTNSYGPRVIYGIPYIGSRTARLALLGDSIMRGMSQIDTDDGLNIIPPLSQTSVNPIAAFGELGVSFGAIYGHRRRIALIDGCTAWMCNYGTNDMKGGASFNTLPIMQAMMIAAWTIAYQRLGVPGIQWTLGPYTTSTDTWATVANQTIQPAAGYSNPNRIAVNNWLRDGAPMLNGVGVATGSSAVGTLRAGMAGHPLLTYYDVADVVESARDSGVFKAGYSFDGIHYSTAAYAAVATAVDWSKLGIV